MAARTRRACTRSAGAVAGIPARSWPGASTSFVPKRAERWRRDGWFISGSEGRERVRRRGRSMALDVWIGDWDDPGSVLATSFEPEAFYWFLYPLIEELRNSHGKYIDLYGGCAFEPQELGIVRQLISDAESLVRQQPDRFRIHVGTQTQPVKREHYTEVDRGSFLKFLGSLKLAADRCFQAGKSLYFYGD